MPASLFVTQRTKKSEVQSKYISAVVCMKTGNVIISGLASRLRLSLFRGEADCDWTDGPKGTLKISNETVTAFITPHNVLFRP